MALFKKKNNEYDNACDQINTSGKSSDRILFEQLNGDDQQVASLVDQMKKGRPLVLDFSKLNVQSANKILSFLSGACYASDAKAVLVKDKVYLFARNVDFMDGSLSNFIVNI